MGTGSPYAPNGAENWGQGIITWLKFFLNLGLYSSPLYFPWILRRVESYRQNPRSLADAILFVSCVYAVGVLLRACGRRANPAYVEFNRNLRSGLAAFGSPEGKARVARYDFDFASWPVEFNATSRKGGRRFLPPPTFSAWESVVKFPQRLVGWAMVNSFGFKMIYPGSVASLQYLMAQAIAENRANLVRKVGERFKLRTEDGNHIDSMFFDRRKASETGRKLVIVCEGNAGFYEMGMLSVPLDKGYSVVGWNHPGFWGSTGSPFPGQDARAADAVMQFAQERLGFKDEDIIVYGWSIGGFTATWLAMNYPNIHALILDATFDHITPLAIERMPAFLESTVELAVRDNFNLAVADQLSAFSGPVRLIRRSKDEMITTDDTKMGESNRGNWLLVSLLQTRFPELFTEGESEALIRAYLSQDISGQENYLKLRAIEPSQMEQLLSDHVKKHGPELPLSIGKGLSIDERANIALFLASRYMSEYDTTHCIPITPNLFQLPWAPGKEEASAGDGEGKKAATPELKQ